MLLLACGSEKPTQSSTTTGGNTGTNTGGNTGGNTTIPPAIVIPGTMLSGNWITTDPRVINTSATASIALIAQAPAGTTRIDFVPKNGGATLPFVQSSDGTFRLSLTPAQMLSGYTPGDLHNVVGFAHYYTGATANFTGNAVINVRDGGVPDAAVTSLAADAQRTAHVVNIRYDSIMGGGSTPASPIKRFYQLLGDDYDFIAVVEQVDSYANRNYQNVSSIEIGIGSTDPFSRAASFGSAGKLQGLIDFPISSYYDLGQQAALHEMGHRWINYASHIAYVPGRPHWPISDLAYGIMGYSLADGAGGEFNFTLTPNGNGDYTLHTTTEAVAYNDYELYLMGLAPASEVIPHFVFQNQNQADQLKDGGVWKGPVTVVTINDVIAFMQSPRVPAYGVAQTNFRMATLVLSQGRLLSADELSYFDAMAVRGEATVPLHYSSGLITGTSWPFYLATKKRGTLTTSIK